MSDEYTTGKRLVRMVFALVGFLLLLCWVVDLNVYASVKPSRISSIGALSLIVVTAGLGAYWIITSITSLPAYIRSICAPASSPLRRAVNAMIGVAGILLGIGTWLGFLLLSRIAIIS